MSSLPERVQIVMDEQKLTQSALATIAGVTKGWVNQWLSGEGKSMAYTAADKINARYGYSIKWLVTGAGDKMADPALRDAPAFMRVPRVTDTMTPNTYAGPEIRGRVPIISWIQAGQYSSVVDNFQPGDADEWAETTVPVRRHTYALRVRGDSMTNPNGEPTFPDGQVIVVEPDAIDTPDKLVGSFVIAKRTNDDEATFKQLVRDAGQYFLKPLNPRYPMLELREGDVLCGVVREKVIRYF